MKLIDRYITKQVLASFFWCLAVFILLYIIIDIFGLLHDIVRKGVTVSALCRYYASFICIIFVQVSPLAILLATLHTLGNLNKNREIVALKASGVSLFKIVLPFFLIGLLLSFAEFIINDYLVPQARFASTMIREREIEKKGDFSRGVMRHVTLRGTKNRIFYVGSYNILENSLKDITIIQHDKDKNLESKIIAGSARWTGNRWLFYNVATYRPGNAQSSPSTRATALLDIEERPEDFFGHKDQSLFLNRRDLRNYIRRRFESGEDPLKELIDFHSKLAFPFINFIIVLIGIPFALSSPRQNPAIGFSVAVGLSLLYYGVNAVSITLGKQGWLTPMLASWLANILFAIVGLILFRKARFPK